MDPEAFRRACSEVPGCTETRTASTSPREPVFRVEVVREASGSVRIGAVDVVRVLEQAGVPLAPLTGDRMLVGLDAAGDPVDGQPIAFPRTLRAESVDRWSPPVETDLAGHEVNTIGYVRALPDVVELAVLSNSGEPVDRAPAPAAELVARLRARAFDSSPRLLTAGVPTAAVGRLQDDGQLPEPAPGALPPHCSHVRILEGDRDRALAGWAADLGEIELLEPGPTQRAAIHSALGMMTPLLCHGVSRIAIGYKPDEPGLGGQVRQLSAGDLLLLNTAADYAEEDLAGDPERQLRMIHTVIHETAHTAEALLNAEGSKPRSFTGDWEPASRSLADETIDNVRLESGLLEEWQLAHRSFVRQGWASAYGQEGDARAAARARSAAETASAGFMSRYAGTSYAEDIADSVAWLYLGDDYRAAGIPEGRRQTEDYACQQMRAHGGDGVPSRFAAIYTKLWFLADLGLVKTPDVERCTGPVGLPNEQPGFHFWQDGDYRRSFGTGVTAIIGTGPSGNYVFEMEAEGEAEFGDETFPARVRLRLGLGSGNVPVDEVSWPRGVYELGLLAAYDLGTISESGATADSGFSLRLEGEAAGNFDVYDGFALVAEASNRRIAGSLVIRRAMRLQAPLPVPQTFDPPLVVRFAIEK